MSEQENPKQEVLPMSRLETTELFIYVAATCGVALTSFIYQNPEALVIAFVLGYRTYRFAKPFEIQNSKTQASQSPSGLDGR